MSPDLAAATAKVQSFPRVSGDEPDHTSTSATETEFSPRERG